MSVGDVLIIPTFSRPELLWLCLDHIVACPEAQELKIRVVVDAHVEKMPPLPEIQQVLAQFPILNLEMQVRTPHRYHGNSFNVMTAYRDAYLGHARYVFMIEDDVMVMPTFFQWHRQVQATEKPACSIGVVKTERMHQYASLGVCFPRQELAGIVEHYCVEYFTNMRGYLSAKFPKSKYEFEQDGLWCRVLSGKKIVWATSPQARHVGWYGYHRRQCNRPVGNLRERYAMVKNVLKNPTLLKQWAKDFRDIETLP